MRDRDIDKWSICRDWRFGHRWVVFAPGSWIRASFVGATFDEAREAYIRLSREARTW
ncbi:hypothetical protein GCM10010353_47380 [Streptomyces chryseus]|nr:hypothetical protein GCM10010353_47380 [Streptomyces chryseus]